MSKVKGADADKWKHAIDPLTQSDKEGGTPALCVCLSSCHDTDKNINLNLSFHGADAEYTSTNSEKLHVNNKNQKQ